MVMNFRQIAMAGLALAFAFPNVANAQDIDLASGGADHILKGTKANAKAGAFLDHGDISGDGRRDLIISAPGVAGITGSVYIVFGGPERTGEASLATTERGAAHPGMRPFHTSRARTRQIPDRR